MMYPRSLGPFLGRYLGGAWSCSWFGGEQGVLELRSFVPQLTQEAGLANAGLTSPL